MISQSETKEQFLRLRKRKCHDLTVVTVTAVAHSRIVQLSTAVTFRCGLPVLSKVQPEGGPATARLAKRLECSSAVSNRLCDTAHSVLQL
jgi:hypothetical protein